ncbi:Intracellular septation protein [Aquicella siphonis]|uniref:Inner membrane-spanning protein YciB n=1 Tax=Aquicella siphonis TaxID=254247 RepID=A0A5E4PHP2_9COXI|nr:septation protein A [Aquicella siphonis]VVC75893.1 Intracellular septation protein [Aquicella siphonis]
MQLFYEIFPVFLFFLAFKFYGIYVATVVGIVTTFLQVFISRVWMKAWDKKQLITLAVFVVFGGMTLYFHDPIFVKWKPTVVFWLFAVALLVTHYFTHKPLMQRLMENMLQEKGVVPSEIWRRLNLVWAAFFIVLGTVNLYVAYFYSNDAWVNFKFYGVTGALFLFSILQALYLSRYLVERNQTHDEKQ